MSLVFQSAPVHSFDVMNEPVQWSALFQITRLCGNGSRSLDDGNDEDDNDNDDDEGGDDDDGADDDAGDDVLQIADFTANHLSCFSWWLQRCQEDCAQSQKYEIQKNKNIKNLFPASHTGSTDAK